MTSFRESVKQDDLAAIYFRAQQDITVRDLLWLLDCSHLILSDQNAFERLLIAHIHSPLPLEITLDGEGYSLHGGTYDPAFTFLALHNYMSRTQRVEVWEGITTLMGQSACAALRG